MSVVRRVSLRQPETLAHSNTLTLTKVVNSGPNDCLLLKILINHLSALPQL